MVYKHNTYKIRPYAHVVTHSITYAKIRHARSLCLSKLSLHSHGPGRAWPGRLPSPSLPTVGKLHSNALQCSLRQDARVSIARLGVQQVFDNRELTPPAKKQRAETGTKEYVRARGLARGHSSPHHAVTDTRDRTRRGRRTTTNTHKCTP